MDRRTFIVATCGLAVVGCKRAMSSPVKLSGPIMVGGEHVWEEPYNRVQIFGSVIPNHIGKWRMFYIYQSGVEASGNKLFNTAYAESLDGLMWTKPIVGTLGNAGSSSVIENQQCWGVYYDHYVGLFRGAGYSKLGYSHNGVRWTTSSWISENDTCTSLLRFQPFSPNSGNPFVAFVRHQGSWANGILRRVAYVDSGDFNIWSAKQSIAQFDSPDGGWTQPYALAATVYGDKIVGLLWWLHLDNTLGNNTVGTLDAELVWLTPPSGARFLSECGPWTRTNQTFLSVGSTGSFDAGMAAPAPLVVHGETVYVYYTAAKTKHGAAWGPGDLSIGLATMPKADLDAILGA